MNIHEYQAKELLRSYGIPVPNGEVIHNPEEAEKASWRIGTDIAVVKAQIHAGGRGKAGGVKIAKSIDEVKEYSKKLLGKKLVTHQTGEEGKEVKAVLIEEGCEIHKEYYLGFVLDRDKSSITIIASEEGGTEIEEVALKSPDKIYKETIDYLIGLTEFQARRICFNINLPLEIINDSVKFMMNLYQLFVEKDCTQVEINPLVLTKERKLIALDAKINFDENGLFRNKDISNYRDLSEEDEKEIEASKHGLSYISLDGNIGCVVNGAGLAMATMDLIKFYGGEPANFLDVGGGATEENVTNAFKIILLDHRVKGIFVNIFGGIMKCDVMAKGIVNAAKELQLDIPIVIRLEGTNADLGMEIIKSSSFNIFAAKDMDEGAKKILELIK
ncbi:ADP-forming succinate--CoA ligase subunit beta [Tissierella sp. MB52-C2]|uniref:ADP-forming succinate--CoA ligase subunit beta n=1 Tax=Tissierella sp. MB52-C2 TaxID=3070999 RepID=UPI00280B7382|nr:ADP-forming succinate--CoA ligase subunit beta [Tissierella sp. MB52-C2]WMM25806.1 ADP-forming succinate--CoA ligase subunit beta [Tissierella sp. MB52-C2]